MTGEAEVRSSSRGRARRETGSGYGASARDRSSSTKARRRREPRTAAGADDDTNTSLRESTGALSPKARAGRSRTPTGRKIRAKSREATGIIGDLPLAGDDETHASSKSSSAVSKKLKKQRSKGKDLKKDASSSSLKSNLHDGGYGSDGALDDAKKRARERRKKLDKSSSASSARGRAKSPKPGKSKSAEDVSLSPGVDNLLSTPKKKKSALSKISKMFKIGNDSTSTLGTLGDEEDDEDTRSTGRMSKASTKKSKKGKIRSSSAGPLSRRRAADTEVNVNTDPQFMNRTKEEIAKENIDLAAQLDREELRNKRLKKKLQELRKEVLAHDGDDVDDKSTTKLSLLAASGSADSTEDGIVGSANGDVRFDRLEREVSYVKQWVHFATSETQRLIHYILL